MERKAVGPSHAFYRTILAMLDGLVCGQSGLRLQPYLLYWLCEVSKNQPLHKTTVLCPGSTGVGCPGVTNDLGDLYAESGQTLQGSFSAESKPNFASKYSLESSRRDLHNGLLCTVISSQIFVQRTVDFFAIFCQFVCQILLDLICPNFAGILPEFAEIF